MQNKSMVFSVIIITYSFEHSVISFHVVSSGFKSLFSELWGQYRDLEVNRIK